jgi:hypothetical protein
LRSAPSRISPLPPRPPHRTIVTAADHRFARTLWQMLRSMERERLIPVHTVVVFDLGLTAVDRRWIERRFSWCAIETFPFERFPAHVRRLSAFAWKPLLVDEALRARGGQILWLDSATLFHGPLDPIYERIARDGLFTLVGQTALGDCCDPRTLAIVGVPASDLQKPYRCGGALGFDASRRDVLDLVERWRDLALLPDCFDPPGADPRTHKFDQAVFTALLYPFARERGLMLRDEEVDISSSHPVPWFSTRNKVAPWMPVALDPLVRAYYAMYKAIDRAAWRLRRAGF